MDNDWHYCVLNFDNGSIIKWYIDNAVDSEINLIATPHDLEHTQDLQFGRLITQPGSVSSQELTGSIDKFGIYPTRILSVSEIDHRYNIGLGRNFTGSEESLGWASNFAKGSGSVVTAVEGNNGNINDTAAITWITGTTGFQQLTSTLTGYDFHQNITSKQIQYRYKNYQGSDFEIPEYKIFDPFVMDNR